jgi:hypothetical protein
MRIYPARIGRGNKGGGLRFCHQRRTLKAGTRLEVGPPELRRIGTFALKRVPCHSITTSVNVPPISAASRALRGVIDMEHGSRCLKGASRDGTWEAKHFGAAIDVFDWLYVSSSDCWKLILFLELSPIFCSHAPTLLIEVSTMCADGSQTEVEDVGRGGRAQ